MHDFVAEFEANQYEPLACALVKQTDQYIMEHEDEIRLAWNEQLARLTSGAMQAQEDGALYPVSYLTLSLLYTSVCARRPQIRLDFYDAAWVLEDAGYSAQMDVPWLFTYWEEHWQKLVSTAKDLGLRSRVRASHLKKMLWQSVRMLAYLAAGRIKYWIREFAETDAYKQLRKNDAFYITFGEYQDWQDTICAALPPIDLFNRDDADELQFRSFYRCVYKNKTFTQMDLSGCRFDHCRFEGCTFTHVILNDCEFTSCVFRDTTFTHSQMLGVTMTGTALHHILLRGVVGGPGDDCPAADDLFKETEFDGCSLEDVRFENCDFPDCRLYECMLQGIETRGGDYADSDLLKLGEPEETEEEGET